MANGRFRPSDNMKGAPTGHRAAKKDSLNESVPNWGGLPGKTGPDRANSVKKLKVQPQQKGL